MCVPDIFDINALGKNVHGIIVSLNPLYFFSTCSAQYAVSITYVVNF